jgi:hypothetical protein
MKMPTALGDEVKSKLVLVRDSVPLPKSRTDKVEAFRQILSLGGVQKIVLEVGKPISFYRLVSEEQNAEIPPANTFDPIELVRIGEIEEAVYMNDKNGSDVPMTILFKAFNQVVTHGAVPGFFVASSPKVLSKWLYNYLLPKDMLFGLPIRKSHTIPDDAVFLAGVSTEDPDVVIYSVRIPLDQLAELEKKEATK